MAMVPSGDHDNPVAALPTPGRLRNHALPLVLVLLSTLIALLGNSVAHTLRYERDAIRDGEWWRLITGNLVHLGWPHLLLNLAGLLLVWLLFHRSLSIRNWIIVTLSSAVAVTGGLLLLDPHLEWYVGLSGVLHGLFAAGVLGSLLAGNRAEWLLLMLFIAKLAWEQWVGAMPGTAGLAGGTVIVDAHLYGATGGAISSLLLVLLSKSRRH
jgi:rhomboid family GlyGly-CTERM serine protease